MKHRPAFGLFSILFAVAAPSLRADIIYSQAPDPFKALEGTSGNLGFITLTNNDPNSIAFITAIVKAQFNATGGESDDQATNLALVAPNPTAANPVQIGPNGTANIKFSWDAVDNIKDNDVDSGDWAAIFAVDYHYVQGTDLIKVVSGNVRVADAPEPYPSSLIMIGIVLLVTGRATLSWRK
jgi:hypothetical protein